MSETSGPSPRLADSLETLRDFEKRMHVAMVTETYPPEVKSQSEDQLVEGLVRDAAKYRWGAFGDGRFSRLRFGRNRFWPEL